MARNLTVTLNLSFLARDQIFLGSAFQRLGPKYREDLKTKFVLLMLVLIQTKSEKTLLSAKNPF